MNRRARIFKARGKPRRHAPRLRLTPPGPAGTASHHMHMGFPPVLAVHLGEHIAALRKILPAAGASPRLRAAFTRPSPRGTSSHPPLNHRIRAAGTAVRTTVDAHHIELPSRIECGMHPNAGRKVPAAERAFAAPLGALRLFIITVLRGRIPKPGARAQEQHQRGECSEKNNADNDFHDHGANILSRKFLYIPMFIQDEIYR